MDNDTKRTLVQAALDAQPYAYAPYSRYPVGAALLTEGGRIFTGVNVENAAYPTGMCAERTAVFKAVSEGERRFSAIAVVTHNGGSPCGACRQVLAEFGLDAAVLIGDETGRILQETNVRALLPASFGPEDLRKDTG
ncbi:MAG TPA: cytidine deaminase [Anaerolineales bacterium]|nr:cytidine deaminase [Anaerolineales bacterium]